MWPVLPVSLDCSFLIALLVFSDLYFLRTFFFACFTRSLVLCVCCVDRCLSFWPSSFGHYAVCPTSIFGFLLPLWYHQTLLNVIVVLYLYFVLKEDYNYRNCPIIFPHRVVVNNMSLFEILDGDVTEYVWWVIDILYYMESTGSLNMICDCY